MADAAEAITNGFIIDKWRILASEEVNTFLDYFSNEWVRETTNTVTGKKTCHNKWYEGAHKHGCPSSDNGLESTNTAIKKKPT